MLEGHSAFSGVHKWGWGPGSPLFENMILEINPKTFENFTPRIFLCICESLKGVAQKSMPAPLDPTTRVLHTPLRVPS